MLHPDIETMLLQERRQDLQAEADHARLVKEALRVRRENAGPRQPARLRRVGDTLLLSAARLLSTFGEWLLNLSCRMQTRRVQSRGEMLGVDFAENQASPCG